MQILPKKIFSYNSQLAPSFKANNRWVYDNYGNELYKTTTYYLRGGFDFGHWADYVHNKYKNVPKVNFVCHACSNGMEPFSYVLALLVKYPEDIDKFTPILAKDINMDNICAAIRGNCGASDMDFRRIVQFTKGMYNKFFNLKPSVSKTNTMILEPKPILKDRVIFQQGDMTKDINQVQQQNTIFAAMNTWLYMHPVDQEKFAKDISRRFPDDSATIHLGKYDIYGKELMKKEGFKEIGDTGIFSR